MLQIETLEQNKERVDAMSKMNIVEWAHVRKPNAKYREESYSGY